MIKRKTLTLALIGAGAMLHGCVGGGPEGVVNAKSAPQVITTFMTVLSQLPQGPNAQNLPANIGGGVNVASVSKTSMKNIAKKADKKSGRNIAADPDWATCITESPASPVDADSDHIALLKNYTFDCENASIGGSTYTYKGTAKFMDKDDTVQGIKGGYRYEFNITDYTWKDATTGNTFGYSHIGFWDGKGTDTTSTYKADYTSQVKSTFTGMPGFSGPVSVDYTMKYKFDGTYTHDAAWNNGKLNAVGSYEFNGTYLGEHDAAGNHTIETGSAVITYKTTNLEFSSSCSKYYRSGTWEMTDMGGNVIKLVFSCTAMKAYMNGTEIDGTW